MNALKSTVVRKLAMAITGLMLIGYLAIHMIGNLTIYMGEDGINNWGLGLHAMPALLWAARIVLLVGFFMHIANGIGLTLQNKAARPQKYAKKSDQRATLYSKTMILSGVGILAFVVYHVMHFTLHTFNPEFGSFEDAAGRHDIFKMVVTAFDKGSMVAVYVIAMIGVMAHLTHGFGSMLQTFGLTNKNTLPATEKSSTLFAWLLLIGFLSIPLSILLGWINL